MQELQDRFEDVVALNYVMTWCRVLVDRLPDADPDAERRRFRGDLGQSLEFVLIVGGMAALALVVVGIIVVKVKNSANCIPTSAADAGCR